MRREPRSYCQAIRLDIEFWSSSIFPAMKVRNDVFIGKITSDLHLIPETQRTCCVERFVHIGYAPWESQHQTKLSPSKLSESIGVSLHVRKAKTCQGQAKVYIYIHQPKGGSPLKLFTLYWSWQVATDKRKKYQIYGAYGTLLDIAKCDIYTVLSTSSHYPDVLHKASNQWSHNYQRCFWQVPILLSTGQMQQTSFRAFQY